MKYIALSLLLIVLALQYRLWISDGGMREVWRLRREVAAQTSQNDALKDRNRQLAAEVQDLKKGKSAIEERARTDLGMVGNNETFFQVASKTAVSDSKSALVTAQASPGVAESNAATPAHQAAVAAPSGPSPLALSASH